MTAFWTHRLRKPSPVLLTCFQQPFIAELSLNHKRVVTTIQDRYIPELRAFGSSGPSRGGVRAPNLKEIARTESLRSTRISTACSTKSCYLTTCYVVFQSTSPAALDFLSKRGQHRPRLAENKHPAVQTVKPRIYSKGPNTPKSMNWSL